MEMYNIRYCFLVVPQQGNKYTEIIEGLSDMNRIHFDWKGYPPKNELINHILSIGYKLEHYDEDEKAGYFDYKVQKSGQEEKSFYLTIDIIPGEVNTIKDMSVEGTIKDAIDLIHSICLKFGACYINIREEEEDYDRLFLLEVETSIQSFMEEVIEYINKKHKENLYLREAKELKDYLEENRSRPKTIKFEEVLLGSDEISDYYCDWFQISFLGSYQIDAEYFNPLFHNEVEIQMILEKAKAEYSRSGEIYIFGGKNGKYVISKGPLLCLCYRDNKGLYRPLSGMEKDIYEYVHKSLKTVAALDLLEDILPIIKSTESEHLGQTPKYLLRSSDLMASKTDKSYYFDDIDSAKLAGIELELNKFEIIDISTQNIVFSEDFGIPEGTQMGEFKTKKDADPDPHGIWDMLYPNREDDEEIDLDDFFKNED